RNRRRRSLVVERDRRRPPLILHAHVRDDAVDPRRQPRLAPEIREAAMNAEKNILREILGPRPILHRARDQCENEAFVPIDQLLERALVAGTAPLDERALVDRLHPPPY